MAKNGNGRAIKAFLSVRSFKAVPSVLFGMIATHAGILKGAQQ